MKTKVVKVSAAATRGFWTRPFWVRSMDSVVGGLAKKGWKLTSTAPITGRGGKTTHYLLTFQKE